MPEKTVMTGSTESGNKRQIGEITGVAALMKECKADEMEKRGEGLYEAFGEGTKALLEEFRAVDQDDTGFSNECHGQFTEAKKTEIALQKLIERNKRVAMTSVQDGIKENDVTCGRDPAEFIREFGTVEGLATLEEMARAHAKTVAVTKGVIDKNTIHAAGTLIWLTSANAIVDYFSITNLLNHRKCCAQIDVNGSWRLFLGGEESMKFQKCIGTIVQDGLPADECEQILEGYEHTFVELFFTDDAPLVIDFDAKSDGHDHGSLHKKVKIPGSEGGYARPVFISEHTPKGGGLISFLVRISCGKVNHHRLVAIFREHYGFGFNRNDLIKTYLKLEDGQSFEDLEGYKYRQDLSDRAIRSAIRRDQHLERMRWDAAKLAKWSDIDHLLGRSKRWKNSDFFCMHVSHSWNRAMSYVRIMYGDWLFGFASVSYESGSD